MTDDRAVETPEQAIAKLREDQADQFSTLLARMQRKPVGDVEIAFRGTPKPGTLFLLGQTLLREQYPALWAWAQESGSVVPGGYTAGNGTTTFTLPDPRGRTIVGAGGTYVLGAIGGADTRVLTVANLAEHDHSVSTGSAGSHGHGGSTGSAGSHGHSGSTNTAGAHGEHMGQRIAVAAGGGTGNLINSAQTLGAHSHSVDINDAGSHSHSLDIDNAGGHTHQVNESQVGSGTPVDIRQPYLAVNLAVWH